MGEEGEKEWEYNGGGDLVQGTLYAWMELSQRNPLELLMHGNSKIKFKKILRIGSLAQEVECLPRKCENLSSNFFTT
jgi:hypothetical protein